MPSPAFHVARLPWQRRDALAPRSGLALAAPAVGRASKQRSISVGPQVMASLRRASPRLRKYFKENYIPQVCEVLEDMCIDPLMKPKIQRLSETYLEQLFGLDDQLVTPELMIKACNFYNGRLLKTHFYTWREVAIPLTNEDEVLAEKMEAAIVYDNFRLKKHVLHHWHSYVKNRKEQLRDALLRIQKMFHCYKMIITLNKWRDRARHKFRKREDELIDFSAVRNIITDKYIVSILQRWRLNVLRLNFRGCVLRLKTLRSVSKYFCNLQNLSLAYCRKFTDKGLQYLNLGSGCHKLIYLDLSGCTQVGNKRITDACFKLIDKSYPNIRHIYMVDCKGITDGSLKSLSPLKHLTVLNLANCVRIGDMGLKQFLDGPASTKIRELNLSNCTHLGDASIAKLSERYDKTIILYIILGLMTLSRHRKLKELSVSECDKITDFGIQITDSAMEMLSAKCHYLHVLDVSGCILLTDQMLENLEMGCRQLRILKMQYCRLISKEAAMRMSSIVQHQEYSASDPPLWFGYDSEGKSRTEQQNTSLKDSELTTKESTYSSEEEAV
ncbi:hypothetical protein FD755_012679 [Muntiacus reevesi]|uniref:F-box/LRR-repeat protein 15-like leucin rich repeat domain-containing protein n=1 Tax=Muntiacus reevesi TaxID=9886 RepID=A0A5N3XQ86_MUNRE|nr:hypothetical protein FD755_012679 [Muntiacus reevesi]